MDRHVRRLGDRRKKRQSNYYKLDYIDVGHSVIGGKIEVFNLRNATVGMESKPHMVLEITSKYDGFACDRACGSIKNRLGL